MAKDKVGYKNPPKESRYKKGESGNPKGRPKQSRNIESILDDVLAEMVIITENGHKREISKLKAAITQQVNKAAKGDPKAFHLLLRMKGKEISEGKKEPLPWNDDDVP